MPSIDVAMAQSVHQRRTLLDVIAAAVQPVVMRRDIADVKTAFSSWDNCMNAVYCKWPVIAVMIIGGLFLISIIWCIARCACCGMSFCCECCYCLKCCGNCCGCCDPPRNRKAKYLDEPYLPPNQGYRSEAPMVASAMPVARAPPMQPPPPQQFASFDVSKTADHGNDDALPVMPSWETADTKKVYVEEEVEMDNLGKTQQAADHAPGQTQGQGMGHPAGYPARMGPGAGPRSTGSPSPISSPNNMVSPYGPPRMPSAAANRNGSHPAAANGYLATGAIPPAADPYSRNSPEAYNNNTGRHSDVSELSADYTLDYNYGAPATGVGSQPSQPYSNNTHTPQQTGYGASPPPGQQGTQGYGQNYQNSGYNNDYRRNGPSNGPSNGTGYSRPNMPMAQPGSQPSYNSMGPPSEIPELDSGDSSIPAGPSYGAGAGAPPAGPGRYATPNTTAGPYGNSNNPASGPYEMGTSAMGGYASPSNGPMSARPPPQRQYTGSSATGYNGGNASRNPGGGNGYGSSYGNGNSNGNGYGSSSYGNANANNGYGSSSGNGGGYGNLDGATNNGYGNMGAANGYGAPTSPPPQTNGAFGIAAGGTSSPMNTGSRPMMNTTASPPPLSQPQPARNYGGYSGYRGL